MAPANTQAGIQAAHRANLLKAFSIPPGSRVLEIGCGQGDCTAVLAEHLGPTGFVDAIDPAPLDYGAPQTLGEAQAELISNPQFGSRISFHQRAPEDFLAGAQQQGIVYSAAVLCHCLWYFSSPTLVLGTLKALRGSAKRLCIAEWSLSSPHQAAQPHIMAAIARATCEAHIPDSDQNIRSLLSPSAIKNLAMDAGWSLAEEGKVTPAEGLADAKWEVEMLLADNEYGVVRRGQERVGASDVERAKVLVVLESMVGVVKESMENISSGQSAGPLRCMDVWWGNFE
ncbi:hypothetical protein BCR34DRAFT_576745 [Clohesyomyces aquaticus]|uniref:S-adenosyl-L-methionine-dependent methyltransferase n=1 Tax=Clohesyomyces aquaticus TaxID=1231657 RepID=A0A1Y1YM97_9PLEO|nr:hypothetical protein BCR34DRAFT_576745 [Clohesyomyces aquaticus]